MTETFLPSRDGVVTRLAHAVEWLAGQGYELCVVAPGLGVDEYRGVPVLPVPAARYPVYSSRRWGTPSPAVARHLAAFRPDLVHAWQPELVGLPAVGWCTRAGVPLVTSYHTDIGAYLAYYGPTRLLARPVAWYERRELCQAPVTLCTSRAAARTLRERGVARTCVLPRGVDLAARSPRFKDEGMRARLSGGRLRAPLAVYVGRLAAEKGLAPLAEAVRARPGWAFAFVGDGPEGPALRRALAGTGAVFTGFLDGAELSRAFASADALVMPSTTETLGLVVAEAQASGTPVVAARSPAALEQLRDGESGLVWDPAEEGSLVRALERLFGDPALASRVRAAGLEEARSCGWDAASAALMDAYRLALGMYALGWRPPRRPGRRPR